MAETKLTPRPSGSGRTRKRPPGITESQTQLHELKDLQLESDERDQLETFLENKIKLYEHTSDLGELKDGDFLKLKTLHSGEGRSVHLARHTKTGLVMVQKVIHRESTREALQGVMTEVSLLHKFNSPFVVNFYGAYGSYNKQEVNILMEHMDAGCLHSVCRRVGRVPENVLSRVSYSVIQGLKYVKDSFGVIHRDIKPSNILANTQGFIKICDFGVSKSLGSMDLAHTFVGTMMYLSPERIQGNEYSYEADLWSLGLSLLELATGNKPLPIVTPTPPPVSYRKPTDPRPQILDRRMAPFALITELMNGPSPSLPEGYGFTGEFQDFCKQLLMKAPGERPSFEEALVHSWVNPTDSMKNEELAAYFQSTLPKKSKQGLAGMMAGGSLGRKDGKTITGPLSPESDAARTPTPTPKQFHP
eukprot:m.334950 g.334950  ORF g.334950 m.334950 type:complete len:418 (+) comp17481_c0_seq1:329-1582(+)